MEVQWPLVIFTLCTCLASGLFAGQGILAWYHKGQKLQFVSLITAFVSIVVGGLASFVHLQHWERAFNGFGHLTSGITQELFAIVALVAVMLAYFLQLRKSKAHGTPGTVPRWTAALAALFSILLVVVMAHSYMMDARPVWDTLLLPLFYLADAGLLGALALWLIASVTGESSTQALATSTLAALLAKVVSVAAYVVYLASVSFTEVGHYFDPTTPTVAPEDPSNMFQTLLTGDLAALFWAGVVVAGIAVTAVLVFLRRKAEANRATAVFAAGALLCAVVGALSWRVILYVLGSSVFVFY